MPLSNLVLAMFTFGLCMPLLAGDAQPDAYTREQMIAQQHNFAEMDTALKAFEIETGALPPNELKLNGKDLTSSEILYHYLCTKIEIEHRQVGPFIELKKDQAKDLSGNGFPSMLDIWGQPIQYDNVKSNAGKMTARNWKDLKDPRKEAMRKEYDIFSFGPPGASAPIFLPAEK